MTHRSARAVVVGCGGTLGFAWTAAILDALPTDPRTADVLVGTSAGAEAVAMLGAGISSAAILGALTGSSDANPLVAAHVGRSPGRFPPVPSPRWPAVGLTRAARRGEVDRLAGLAGLLPQGRGDATWLRDLGAALAPDGWVPHPATWCIATDLAGHRVAFGSPGAPEARLGEAIAASWAIPGWFPPVVVGGQRFLDGGTVSTTSADLLLGRGLDEVVIIAPMSSEGGAPASGLSRVERLLRTAMTRRVDSEARMLRAAGIRVVRIEPGPEDLDAMGANFMDARRREHVLSTALSTAAVTVAQAFERQGVKA
ncbi:patatin-like phospholipase family protein [Kibdelosporangium philippinense]|uniref:Patatin-like phospholipase family protein n=1 Tax=Kibdelosporangium philippinense TaxID=211113 RepID=A0ABS8ZR92_9PSEU|nr:patatin-like phospholipase family protein [Kibdelosporangium philippinense]MCE7010244.1 patatin-like phospholipase family protein [Kibdelosporangium philippinense]